VHEGIQTERNNGTAYHQNPTSICSPQKIYVFQHILKWREVMLPFFCTGDLFCFLLTKQHRDAICW